MKTHLHHDDDAANPSPTTERATDPTPAQQRLLADLDDICLRISRIPHVREYLPEAQMLRFVRCAIEDSKRSVRHARAKGGKLVCKGSWETGPELVYEEPVKLAKVIPIAPYLTERRAGRCTCPPHLAPFPGVCGEHRSLAAPCACVCHAQRG